LLRSESTSLMKLRIYKMHACMEMLSLLESNSIIVFKKKTLVRIIEQE
jgi:hypothetical protein